MMTESQFLAILGHFEDSLRYLKGWAYRLDKNAKDGLKVNPQELAMARAAIKYMQLKKI